MRNLKVFIAYNGAAYHGFQRQDNALTVQEAVENSIGKLLKIPAPVIYGCSRTDTGVHARQFCFNVHVDSRIPCEGFVKGMNTLLPPDIAVLSCEDAPEDFPREILHKKQGICIPHREYRSEGRFFAEPCVPLPLSARP